VIDRALTEVYAAKTSHLKPTLAVAGANAADAGPGSGAGRHGRTDSLVRRIRKFTQGTYAQFFNQATNVTMDKTLVVFGIRDMENELRPAAMYIIMRYVWNKIRAA